ncbi:MAG TPA: HNH endonuclease [Abditibacteriaceae bacterium]|jgi:5-methylcytosine-specific restriction endonuclease McrA
MEKPGTIEIDRTSMICELCGREVGALTLHHLKPKSRRGKYEKVIELPTAQICSACHRQIHALFSNRELADEWNSLEKLRSEERMKKFIAWISKQDPNKRVRVRR